MSTANKPSAAWYLAPIFLGIIGSVIMWYVVKDEDHPDSQKMVRKGIRLKMRQMKLGL